MGGSAMSCQEDVPRSVCGWGLGPRIPSGLLMAFLVTDDNHFHFLLFFCGLESHGIECFHFNTFII